MSHYNYSPVKMSEDGEQYFTMQDSNQCNIITMSAGGVEMLKVSDDGFYVRGVKVTQDDKEAETVYNAFKAFLVWAELNRR